MLLRLTLTERLMMGMFNVLIGLGWLCNILSHLVSMSPLGLQLLLLLLDLLTDELNLRLILLSSALLMQLATLLGPLDLRHISTTGGLSMPRNHDQI